MTKKQVEKLETILAKLEALENEVVDTSARERLSAAKRELLRALPPL
jgi:hypothetical protein